VNLDKLTYAGNRSSLDGLQIPTRATFLCMETSATASWWPTLLREHDINAVMHLAAEIACGPQHSIHRSPSWCTNFNRHFRLLDTGESIAAVPHAIPRRGASRH